MSSVSVNQESLQQKAEIKTRKDDIYKTKKIKFLGDERIIVHSETGASPLVAICNVLLLRGDMNLHPHELEVSQGRLLTLLANTMVRFTSHVTRKDRENSLNAIELLPCLADGINVDIKFNEIDDFEPTHELAIFHSLMIPLYHGWVIEHSDFEAFAGRSYGALMSALDSWETQTVKARSSHVWLTPEKVHVINKFLTKNHSQLTVTGLSLLREKLLEDELCVFFRNKRFVTLIKHDGELFQLHTQKNLGWEKLNMPKE